MSNPLNMNSANRLNEQSPTKESHDDLPVSNEKNQMVSELSQKHLVIDKESGSNGTFSSNKVAITSRHRARIARIARILQPRAEDGSKSHLVALNGCSSNVPNEVTDDEYVKKIRGLIDRVITHGQSMEEMKEVVKCLKDILSSRISPPHKMNEEFLIKYASLISKDLDKIIEMIAGSLVGRSERIYLHPRRPTQKNDYLLSVDFISKLAIVFDELASKSSLNKIFYEPNYELSVHTLALLILESIIIDHMIEDEDAFSLLVDIVHNEKYSLQLRKKAVLDFGRILVVTCKDKKKRMEPGLRALISLLKVDSQREWVLKGLWFLGAASSALDFADLSQELKHDLFGRLLETSMIEEDVTRDARAISSNSTAIALALESANLSQEEKRDAFVHLLENSMTEGYVTREALEISRKSSVAIKYFASEIEIDYEFLYPLVCKVYENHIKRVKKQVEILDPIFDLLPAIKIPDDLFNPFVIKYLGSSGGVFLEEFLGAAFLGGQPVPEDVRKKALDCARNASDRDIYFRSIHLIIDIVKSEKTVKGECFDFLVEYLLNDSEADDKSLQKGLAAETLAELYQLNPMNLVKVSGIFTQILLHKNGESFKKVLHAIRLMAQNGNDLRHFFNLFAHILEQTAARCEHSNDWSDFKEILWAIFAFSKNGYQLYPELVAALVDIMNSYHNRSYEVCYGDNLAQEWESVPLGGEIVEMLASCALHAVDDEEEENILHILEKMLSDSRFNTSYNIGRWICKIYNEKLGIPLKTLTENENKIISDAAWRLMWS